MTVPSLENLIGTGVVVRFLCARSALLAYSQSPLITLDPNIASAGEAFAQFAPHATAWSMFVSQKLRFALAAESFLPGFHGTVAGSYGHGAKLNAAAALLAEIGPDAEGIVHMAFLTTPNKAFRPCLPDLGANPHAASA